MATLRDLDRLARALPETAGTIKGRIAYTVKAKPKPKGFAWSWMERVHPKKARVENRDVIAVRVASLSDKEMLLASDPDVFFTEPHYNGFPAVLVRLAEIDVKGLEAVLTAAWRCLAPAPVIAAYDGAAPRPRAKPRKKR